MRSALIESPGCARHQMNPSPRGRGAGVRELRLPVIKSPTHNLSALLLASAQRHPGLPALAVGTRVRNDYASLATRVARLATTLARTSVAPGDRVAIVS